MAFNLSYEGVTCSVLVKDSVTGERLDSENPFRAILKCQRDSSSNELFLTLSGRRVENCKYNISVLHGLYREMVDEGILVFGFRYPRLDLMLITDVPSQAKTFMKNLFNEIGRACIPLNLDRNYNPGISSYLGLKQIDRNTLNLSNLNMLTIEYCVISSMAGHINGIPISYLSLTGSTLGSNQHERDTFWDWMYDDTVSETLRILEMNRVSLESVPFEIVYLKNLHTLSLAENQLTSIPYYIGELKKLDRLFINNNSLKYLPLCLHDKAFKDFNFSNNKFDDYDTATPSMKKNEVPVQEQIRLLRRKGKPLIHSLFYLSLFSMVDNGIKIKRETLPPALHERLTGLGETLVRCQHCKKLLFPRYSFSYFEKKFINSRNLMVNDILTWNCFECVFKCSKLSDIEFHLK